MSELSRSPVARDFRTVPALMAAPRGPRLVVVGASFAGISLARTVKKLVPDVEIHIIEREQFFVFAPAQLRYLFGFHGFHEIARDYRGLTVEGAPVIRSAVLALDRERRRIVTAEGAIGYDYLALTSGVRLAHEQIPGLAGRPEANVSPYDRGSGLIDLRQRIADFRGGHVLIGTPNGPYTCLPAPYEYALLWAAHLKRHRLKGRITFVDPRAKPTPPAVADGLARAIEAHRSVLTYEPFTQLRSVDPDARTAETEAGRLAYDILSVVPPNTAMPFIADAGLGRPFADVDPKTFRSTHDERIYALGDTADTPYAKTGYTAMASGRIAGEAIARDLGTRTPEAGAPTNICYPMVAPDRALRIEARWVVEQDATGATHVKVEGESDPRARRANARDRRQWERRALSTLFGR